MTQGNAGHNLSVKLQYVIQNHFATQLSVCLAIITEHTAFFHESNWSELFVRITTNVHIFILYRII